MSHVTEAAEDREIVVLICGLMITAALLPVSITALAMPALGILAGLLELGVGFLIRTSASARVLRWITILFGALTLTSSLLILVVG